MKYLILSILLLFLFNSFLCSQSYLIKELKGNIWVTSRVEITNSSLTNITNEGKPKEPIKVNNNIITSEDIDRMGFKNAGEVLANQPGFVNKGNYMGNEVIDLRELMPIT